MDSTTVPRDDFDGASQTDKQAAIHGAIGDILRTHPSSPPLTNADLAVG